MMGEVPHLAPENTKPVEMGYVPKTLNHNTYVTECRNCFSLEQERSPGKQAVMLGRWGPQVLEKWPAVEIYGEGEVRKKPEHLQQTYSKAGADLFTRRNPIKLPSCGFPLMLRGTCQASPQGPR